MFRNKINLRNVVAIAICLAGITMFHSCEKKEQPQNITVSDKNSLTQEVFADNISGKSMTSFTTTDTWTSSITAATTTPKSANSATLKRVASEEKKWVSITPDHGDKAGTYNVTINLEPNITGEDRTAIITITCKGENITITVKQKGAKADGAKFDPVGTWWVEKTEKDFGFIFKRNGGFEVWEDKGLKSTGTWKIQNGRLSVTAENETLFFSIINFTTIQYTDPSGAQVTLKKEQ